MERMLKFLSHLKLGLNPNQRPEIKDAKRIYALLMQVSRKPEFFGEAKCPDTMTGRMEILCLHLGIMHYVLRNHGENGKALGQALYDVMIEDFDIALREEGISDSGLKRRIKPMAKMFYGRAKDYADAFDGENEADELLAIITSFIPEKSQFINKMVVYSQALHEGFKALSFAEIAKARLKFPSL